MRFKKSIVILFLVISPSLKSQTDVENKMITNDVDDINNEQFDIEKIRIRDSSRALKITFPLGQDTLRLTSDVDEIPHHIKIISQAFIPPSDTVFCKINFISNDSILLADCSIMWVDKNNLSKQSIVKKVSENKKKKY